MGGRAERGVAAPCDSAAFTDTHFRIAAAQGILADVWIRRGRKTVHRPTREAYREFCQMLLNGGVYAHERILRRATVAQFTTPQQLSGGTRTLGWAVPTEGGSSGHYFSAHSFGHTGFTGTSIWIDPDRQLFVVLLTNRVHPTRENTKIQKVRVELHDAVMRALGFATAAAPAK